MGAANVTEESIKYQTRTLWLRLILVIGLLSVIFAGIAISEHGIKLIYLSVLLTGASFIFQFRSFALFGYIVIDEEAITINNGLSRTKLLLVDISQVVQRRYSYKLKSKNGKSNYIGLHFVKPELKSDLIRKLTEIENKLNTLQISK